MDDSLRTLQAAKAVTLSVPYDPASYDTITPKEARERGLRPVSCAYSIRRIPQRLMLKEACEQMQGAPYQLVANAAGSAITIWR